MFEEANIVTISPSLVEGIQLSEHDISNPDDFWSQHMSGGTEETFKDIASQIPNVQKELDSGKTLSEIMENPELSECASIYFNPKNIPEVIKCGDYYEFQSNGRHRILAARDVGHDMPVKVIGERGMQEPDTAYAIDGVDNPPNQFDEIGEDPPNPFNEIDEVILKENFITNDGETITYKEAVDRVKEKADKYMAKNGVSTVDRERILTNIESEMYLQESKARERGIGDHGIRHIYENVQRSEQYLSSYDKTDKPSTTDEHLGCIIAHVYHDHGYMDDDVHNRNKNLGDRADKDGTKYEFVQDADHDLRSQKYFDEKIKAEIDGIFKNRATVESVSNAIGSHNIPDADYVKGTRNKKVDEYGNKTDGKKEIKENISGSDRIESGVLISDKLALTQREKFSHLLKNNPEFVKLTEGMNSLNNMLNDEKFAVIGLNDKVNVLGENGELKQITFKDKLESEYKAKLCESIEKSDFEPDVKSAYIHAIKTDMGMNSGKFSSRMDFIRVPSDCMKVDSNGNTVITVQKIKYEESNENLQKVQDGQIKKLYEDLGVEYSEAGRKELEEKYHITLNIEEISIAEVEKLESDNGFNNDDFRTINENLNEGDKIVETLSKDLENKWIEVAEVLKSKDIDVDKFDKIKEFLEDESFSYDELPDNASRQEAIKKMLQTYTQNQINSVVNTMLNKEV